NDADAWAAHIDHLAAATHPTDTAAVTPTSTDPIRTTVGTTTRVQYTEPNALGPTGPGLGTHPETTSPHPAQTSPHTSPTTPHADTATRTAPAHTTTET